MSKGKKTPAMLQKFKDAKDLTAQQATQSRFLVQSIELEESEPPHILSTTSFVMCGIVFLALIWAGITQVDQVASATGQVVPVGSIQAVQHLEGGIVQQIHVRDGDVVQKGDQLIQLSPVDVQAELEQLRVRAAKNMLELERNRALIEQRSPDFDGTVDGYYSMKLDQAALHKTQVKNTASQEAVFDAQLEQQIADQRRLKNRLDALREDERLLDEELATRQKLFDDGLTTRLALLDIQRQHAQATVDIKETQDQLAGANESVIEAETRIVEFQNKTRTDILAQIGDLSGELAETRESVKRAEARAERSDIRAPIAGVVKGLEINAINAVVQPGQTLMEIVPTGKELVVEAELPPQYIGQVYIGQEVDVRLNAFDFATFGSVSGTLERVSASTFQTDQGDLYYRAVVALEKNYVGDNPDRNKLLPGMTVQANIITGEKSILDYLLKPVYRGFSQSFSEK